MRQTYQSYQQRETSFTGVHLFEEMAVAVKTHLQYHLQYQVVRNSTVAMGDQLSWRGVKSMLTHGFKNTSYQGEKHAQNMTTATLTRTIKLTQYSFFLFLP